MAEEIFQLKFHEIVSNSILKSRIMLETDFRIQRNEDYYNLWKLWIYGIFRDVKFCSTYVT